MSENTIQAAYKETTLPRDTLDKVVELESSRLDDMLSSLFPKMMEGDLEIVEPIIQIMKQRSKLLGLDYEDRILKDIFSELREIRKERRFLPVYVENPIEKKNRPRITIVLSGDGWEL